MSVFSDYFNFMSTEELNSFELEEDVKWLYQHWCWSNAIANYGINPNTFLGFVKNTMSTESFAATRGISVDQIEELLVNFCTMVNNNSFCRAMLTKGSKNLKREDVDTINALLNTKIKSMQATHPDAIPNKLSEFQMMSEDDIIEAGLAPDDMHFVRMMTKRIESKFNVKLGYVSSQQGEYLSTMEHEILKNIYLNRSNPRFTLIQCKEAVLKDISDTSELYDEQFEEAINHLINIDYVNMPVPDFWWSPVTNTHTGELVAKRELGETEKDSDPVLARFESEIMYCRMLYFYCTVMSKVSLYEFMVYYDYKDPKAVQAAARDLLVRHYLATAGRPNGYYVWKITDFGMVYLTEHQRQVPKMLDYMVLPDKENRKQTAEYVHDLISLELNQVQVDFMHYLDQSSLGGNTVHDFIRHIKSPDDTRTIINIQELIDFNLVALVSGDKLPDGNLMLTQRGREWLKCENWIKAMRSASTEVEEAYAVS